VAYCIAVLFLVNFYFAKKLFFVDFTNNMQTNAGSFMALARFIMERWPHLGWFPWWFSGEPFENSYTPLLHLADAAFAWLTGGSPARAYNFVTGGFYVLGPVFLFLFAWRITRYLETSFLAALLYSLYSPSIVLPYFHAEAGLWDPFRLRVLLIYGEGPHITALGLLPIALLFVYLALHTRKYFWCAAASGAMAAVTLVNAFGAVDLAFGCACLILALSRRDMAKAGLLAAGMIAGAYLLACPFLTPRLLHTMVSDAQTVGGHFESSGLFSTWALILPGFVILCFTVRLIEDYFLRFALLFTFLFFAIVALFTLAGRAALPQPHRYNLELEMAFSLAAVFALRKLVMQFPLPVKALGVVLIALAAGHQVLSYHRYARAITQKLDVTGTIEYKEAKWIGANLGDLRVFASAQTGTWLNVFVDTPQMHSGHDPFNPNYAVEEGVAYFIYSSTKAIPHDGETSVLWLKAFGCHAITVPGPKSRLGTKPFQNPGKFAGILPVLWHEEDDTIYAVPERTRSLAHVVPESAIVNRPPYNGVDIEEVTRYVAALDGPSLPADEMTWPDPEHGHIDTNVHPGQVLSIQSTYDPGWIAIANGKPARVSRDGLGLSVVHASCDGACSVDFVYDGGFERHFVRGLWWATVFAGLLGGVLAYRTGKLI
jgi:hypothetical protein